MGAHKEQKIAVGSPMEEISRICPEDGRILGSGGILRLGGARIGGFGESDIAYAYRQLSRVLHPDKNPHLTKAPMAFLCLTRAAEDLRTALSEQRRILQLFTGVLGLSTTPEMLERPQEALLAETIRLLLTVCGASGEGDVRSP